MQYPSEQQPPHQPQASSEIYLPEQPQVYPLYQPQPLYMQSQEMMQTPVADIAIYPNRRRAILLLCMLVVIILIMISMFALLVFGSSPINHLKADEMAGLIIISALLIVVIVFYGSLTWHIIFDYLCTSHLLLINQEGITVGRMPLLSSVFISWAEIEVISTYTFMYKYLSITPRNPQQFLARFNPLERFNRQSNIRFGMPLIIVPQALLERPVAEILQQVYYQYARELNYYHVQLRP